MISRSETSKALRTYADEVGCRRGEYELANGILKAACFIEDCENIRTAYDINKVIGELRKIQYEDECCETSLVVETERAEKIIRSQARKQIDECIEACIECDGIVTIDKKL